MKQFPIDRRTELRGPTEGNVRLFPDRFSEVSVSGQLLDISSSGFRATHNCPALSGGEVVGFKHASGEGRARVVWTRIVSGQAESGFVVVEA